MERYEYCYLNLDDGAYFDSAVEKAGGIFEILVHHLGFNGDEAVSMFIESGLAEAFERRNPVYVSGKSCIELAQIALEKASEERPIPDNLQLGFTAPYWIGEMATAFQIRYGVRYSRLFGAVPYRRFTELYAAYGELTPDEFGIILKAIIESQPFSSPLKQLRKARGITQWELASRSGVSLRAIQQYEQGSKDVRKAAADSVYRLSMVLGCNMVDLL